MILYTPFDEEDPFIDERIEKEMFRLKIEAQRKIAIKVVSSTEEFSEVLACGFFNSDQPAINLAEELDLTKLDFLAILGNFELFKQAFLEENYAHI